MGHLAEGGVRNREGWRDSKVKKHFLRQYRRIVDI